MLRYFKKQKDKTKNNWVLELFSESDSSSLPIAISADLGTLKKFAEEESDLTLQWEDNEDVSMSEVFEVNSKFIITSLQTV